MHFRRRWLNNFTRESPGPNRGKDADKEYAVQATDDGVGRRHTELHQRPLGPGQRPPLAVRSIDCIRQARGGTVRAARTVNPRHGIAKLALKATQQTGILAVSRGRRSSSGASNLFLSGELMQGPAGVSKNRVALAPAQAVVLAVSFGLCAGYLDIGIMLLGRWLWNSDGYVRSARDFWWTVPAGHAALLLAVAVLVVAVNVGLRRRISLGAGVRLLSALAIWAALLRAPMTGLSSLVLSIGLGRILGKVVAGRGIRPRRLAYASLGLLGILGVLAAVSTGREVVHESPCRGRFAPRQRGASNVILIVWDTVRAYSTSSYGYFRDTTPNLKRDGAARRAV